MSARVTQVEFATLLAVAQDHAFGQPPGSQLRATVIAQHLATAAGASAAVRATTWWTSALRFLGCTGHSFELAALFGDEIQTRARSLRNDPADVVSLLREIVLHAGPEQRGVSRVYSVLALLAGGKRAAELNFRTACEVADAFAARLGLDAPVREALAATFERWNGRGLPAGARGDRIPLPARIAHLAQELEVLVRMEGVDHARVTVAARRGRTYDPVLADVALAGAAGWWQAVEDADPWDAALSMAPFSPALDDGAARESLTVLADFADLKSPWTAGHSRGVAALALAASGPAAEAAALVHDLGRVAVANTVWDKAGALTRDERDRAETHTLVTDQLLRRLPYTAPLAGVASAAHERIDAAGYHRRVGAPLLDDASRVLAAADCYQAMTSERPHRHALTPEAAAAELRSMSAAGRLDGDATERVLAAAGLRRAARPTLPAGLSSREAEVLRLLALGLTTKQVAHRLHVSTKTADHHVQHIYTKIGVSTRGAAALFAMERGILPFVTARDQPSVAAR